METLKKILHYTRQIKVLYVEDNLEARESTIEIFNEFFGSVVSAVNGQDGYEKFKNLDIDLVITDINMPKLNGLEMIEKIRKIDKNVPILVISAYNESAYLIDSIKLGVEGYLLKPMEMNQFLEALTKVTEKFLKKQLKE